MLATAINGEASRGRRAEKMPSGTPRAIATIVEPATSSTCWPKRLASSARCAIQNATSDLISTLRPLVRVDRIRLSSGVCRGGGMWNGRHGVEQPTYAWINRRCNSRRPIVRDQPAFFDDADAIGQRERFTHVVGDDDHGLPQA